MDNETREKSKELDRKALLMTERIIAIIDAIEQNCSSETANIKLDTLNIIRMGSAFLQSWIIKTLDDIDEIYGE